MKNLRCILLTLCVFFFSGCRQEQPSLSWLEVAEQLFESNPDSTFSILNEVAIPDNLEDEAFARWCMLSGKVHDELHNTILPVYQFERAHSWYKKQGMLEEQVKIAIYLGRSHVANGDYDKAMLIYIDALQVAQDNQLDNVAGYASSYMGDLYDLKDMQKEALKKYEMGAQLFQKVGNMKSYAYALRDVAREYAFLDSLSCALKIVNMADSVVVKLGDHANRTSIMNAYGNIYMMQQEYSIAEKYFREALAVTHDQHKIPNYFALIKLYMRTNNVSKALKLLKEVPANTLEYKYSIKKAYYQIYKLDNDLVNAIKSLEESQSALEAVIRARNESKVLEVEKKYNYIKVQSENSKLLIAEQKYIIILTLCLSAFLFIVLAYFFYNKRVKDKIYKKELELNDIKIELLNLSIELEKKKSQLIAVEGNSEDVLLRNEILSLSNKYHKLQQAKVETSAIAKKLLSLSNQNIPQNDKALLTPKHWKSIISEITVAYPNLRVYLLEQCPDLLDQEWRYCCLYMFQLDGNAEAKLLGISPNSVRTKRYRLRQRLKISTLEEESTLYGYLISNVGR